MTAYKLTYRASSLPENVVSIHLTLESAKCAQQRAVDLIKTMYGPPAYLYPVREEKVEDVLLVTTTIFITQGDYSCCLRVTPIHIEE